MKVMKILVVAMIVVVFSAIGRSGQPTTLRQAQGRPEFLRGATSASPATTSRPSPVMPMEINFDNAPLKDVLDYYQRLADVNFHVNWKALAAAGVTAQTPVSLQARDISIARALDLTLDQLNADKDRLSSVYWLMRDGVVEISTGDLFNRTTSTRVFEVADLLMAIPNFKAPVVAVGSADANASSGGDDNSSATEEEDAAGLRQRTRETLIEAIKDSIGREMWAPTGKGNITILRDKLIITQTPLGFLLLERATTSR